MKTYQTYQTEDFVQDPYFRKWALSELPPEDRFWETWQQTHPDQYEILEKAKSMVIALRIPGIEIHDAEIDEAIARALKSTEVDGRTAGSRAARSRIGWWPVAASVLILMVFGYWMFMNRGEGTEHLAEHSKPQPASTDETQLNNGATTRIITLPDSSRVTLEGHSSLRIGRHFGKTTREVYLTGAAFFDVKRDTERPFIVYSGKVVTKVLGTSFRIKAYDADANVSVGVRTGKVTVFKRESGAKTDPMLSEEVILTPNQQAVFVKKEEKFVKTLVEQPAVIDRLSHKNRLDFSETPIPAVLNALEEAYGVKMIYDAENLKECNMTGSLNAGSLYDKLAIVCETIQAHYKVTDGQVVIDGKGCK
ncbi:FecR domain-containing protein [Dyadobacter sp. CY261]|uniref:FecR family protein n=1 Tax=Dyadobacter sp. CY261 TaxID=2907203 RepID=UPI001F2B0E43|nr:FecR family protein [Dyadobacter sp. CY261]MCF0070200.1 FecR domain-containing protein [Dyadobacter sp. CY261]